MDPKLLAGAVVKLKEITLTYTCLTKYSCHHHQQKQQHQLSCITIDAPLMLLHNNIISYHYHDYVGQGTGKRDNVGTVNKLEPSTEEAEHWQE